MPIPVSGYVGVQTQGDGQGAPIRQGRTNEVVVQELHGRFYEQVFRGNMYSIGGSVTALSANTISLTSSGTPIVGVYNPSASTVNVVVLQAGFTCAPNTLTAPVPPGPLVWASSVGNTAVTTGSAPYNRKTMASSGSQAKGFGGGVALTGLTNNLVIFEAADFPNLSGLTCAGTVGASTTISYATLGIQGVENFDGGLIVPPGGVLALLNTTSTTTYSATCRLLWEEVPL